MARRPPARRREAAGDGPAALLALDANADGMLDLVTANAGGGDVTLLAGLGAILR